VDSNQSFKRIVEASKQVAIHKQLMPVVSLWSAETCSRGSGVEVEQTAES
jgi:hypothetical protein